MTHSKDFIGIQSVPTLGHLQRTLSHLTAEQLDFVVPQLKEWRERAIELQAEPAAMAMGMLQLTEERDEWKAIAKQLRILGQDLSAALRSHTIATDLSDLWDSALTGVPWESATHHLYRNAEVIYCATSLDHCWRLFEADMDVTRAEEEDSDPFELIPDDEAIEVGSEDASGDPDEVLRSGYYFSTKLAREWAAISRAGHFSGGDY